MNKKFLVTEDHIRLLQNFNIDWDDSSYSGAPRVDTKRPYGNSCITSDISRILEWEEVDYESDEWADLHQDAIEIHREMEHVLQILISNLKIEPGTYTETSYSVWEKD